MNSRERIIDSLKWQIGIGRTKRSRDLGNGMDDLTGAAITALENEKSGSATIAECKGCEFIALAEGFDDGCPNCGSHDFDLEEVTGETIAEENSNG